MTEVPRLTILSHLSPGSPEKQRVYVYASQSPGDSSKFYTPEDLKVDITEIETDNTITLDRIIDDGKTYFEFPSGFLKEGHSYRIIAFAPGFDIVQASTEIPRPSTIENLIIRDFTIEQPNSQVFKRIIRYKVEFDINHVEPNRYYHLVFTNQ